MNCTACNASITDKFCGQCGRPAQIPRVDGHYIVHEIQHVLHFEKGILYTIKALLREPGTSIHTFITADRSRLVKPILFIIVTSLIYTTINHLFHIEQGGIDNHQIKGSAIVAMSDWVQNHYGYSNIIMGVFIAFWLKIFYRAYRYNFFEVLILLCFVMGIAMLILSVFVLFQGITGVQATTAGNIAGTLYCSWAIGHFFDRKRVASYLKAAVSYILGMATFTIFLVFFGFLVDLIKY
jgi:hypothetical protein